MKEESSCKLHYIIIKKKKKKWLFTSKDHIAINESLSSVCYPVEEKKYKLKKMTPMNYKQECSEVPCSSSIHVGCSWLSRGGAGLE